MVPRRLTPGDLEALWAVINDGARAYAGVIPADCWHDPYMSRAELTREIAAGVEFWGLAAQGDLVAVMGRQDKGEVVLLRHAYVRTAWQRQGLGSRLLVHLRQEVRRPLLVGTWRAATWAIRFYERHGFSLLPEKEKDRLLMTYWDISPRQVETSVVLADPRWFQGS
ncbi:MAG: GNAT family N-acetyltransferase [Syntrophobacterales bacterium]|nr:GNAT family N-acetyltransferase [Syntrophobacterales bacterium]